MKTMKSLLGAIGAGLLFSAQAGAVPLTVTGWEYPSNVTQATIRNNSPYEQSRVYAGGFVTNAGSESFISWCVDIFQNTYIGQTVNDYNKATGVAALGATKANALGRLATHALGSVNNSATAGAFQLAAWEIINETNSSWNLTNGNFRASDVTNGSRSIAQGWLNALAGVTSLYNVHVWQSRTRQDLAVFERVSVPEPATLALFIVGLGGAAFAVRARRAAVRA
jgi:hypothetical protein